jgi:hypothetical protein
MIDYHLDKQDAILYVRPTGPLRQEDFEQMSKAVDPFIEETGGLSGLILEVVKFPGWEDLGAAVRHFRFVRDHHKKIRKIAVVTDSPLGYAAEHITSHFVSAEIKRFPQGQVEAARAWIAKRAEE